MKITFDNLTYEFKVLYDKNTGHELHLFKNDKSIEVQYLHELPSPSMMFDIYIHILKKNVYFDSVKVNFK